MLPEYILEKIPVWEKFKCVEISTGQTVRAKKEEGGTVFVYAKGKSRYGYRWSECQFLNRYDISSYDPGKKEKDWHRKIQSLIKKLESSGLWPEKLPMLRNLDTMTLQDRRAISDIYSERYAPGTIEDHIKKAHEVAEKVRTIYGGKYPFIVQDDKEGNPFIETWYLWEMSDCNTKSMYFGKYWNKHYKEDIKEAIEKKEKITKTARTSYDVSFNYDPEKNMAWYSEEYKDCGNGHYYLAVDHNTAWFCEND